MKYRALKDQVKSLTAALDAERRQSREWEGLFRQAARVIALPKPLLSFEVFSPTDDYCQPVVELRIRPMGYRWDMRMLFRGRVSEGHFPEAVALMEYEAWSLIERNTRADLRGAIQRGLVEAMAGKAGG